MGRVNELSIVAQPNINPLFIKEVNNMRLQNELCLKQMVYKKKIKMVENGVIGLIPITCV